MINAFVVAMAVAIFQGAAMVTFPPGIPEVAAQADAEVFGPDFDGDGYADLAVGSPFEGINGTKAAGGVNVIYGGPAGLSASGNQFWHQDSPGIKNQAEKGDRFGMSLTTGDFDGDGFSDLAVAAPMEDIKGVVNAGAINVIYGSSAGLIADGNQLWHQNKSGILDQAEPSDRFGWALTAGDFDSDGFADLAVGSPYEDINGFQDAGAVNVIYGSADGLSAAGNQLWHQDSPGILDQTERIDLFGRSLAAGDFDGDGSDDLAVGAPYEDYFHENRDGAVHVIHGSRNGLTASGNQLWSQDSPGIRDQAYLREQFGQSLTAGDFDGDGFADLAVGVWFQDFCYICNEGAVNVIYGSASGLTAAGDQFWTQDSPGILDSADPFDRFGHALAAGDFDRDGFTDLAVAAPREDLRSGNVFQDQGGVNVIYGSPAGLTATGNQFWTQDSPGILGTAELGDLFGLALGAADFDGDGSADLVVGIRFEDNVGVHDGGVIAIYGTRSGLAASGNQFWSQDSAGISDQAESGDHFGWSLSTGWSSSGDPGESRPDYWPDGSGPATYPDDLLDPWFF